jgi:hypothetical protein
MKVGKKISDSTFTSLIGLQPDDKVRNICLDLHKSNRYRYFLTLSSGWTPIRLMKVKTDIFLPCHLVEDLLDLWRSRQIFSYLGSSTRWQGRKISVDLHKSNSSPTIWQGKKISDSTFTSLIGLQPDDKVRNICLGYFLTLSSGWRPIRLMKVETDIFLLCHLVGDVLDLWRLRQIFSNICLDLHKSNRSPTRWQGKKISDSNFTSLIGLQPDDKIRKYLSWRSRQKCSYPVIWVEIY